MKSTNMITQNIVIFVKKVFGEAKKHRKVCDHDHYTGKFRGAAIQFPI